MATYPNTARADSLHSADLGQEADDDNDKSILEMETVSDDSTQEHINVFILLVFILELLVLIFVAVLEYFLRFTEVFPVRTVSFSCSDAELQYNKTSVARQFQDFAFNADVPYQVVVAFSFCLPPLIIVIGELALWGFTTEYQKTVRALCRRCKLPQALRRVVRFIGVFLFGMLITLIFTDVTKIWVGRLRPDFLNVCNPNTTFCKVGAVNGDSVCMEKNQSKIRNARLSFPSLYASMTAFAAGYTAVYLHNVVMAHSVKLLRGFLALTMILMSILCCLSRYGLRKNYWTDLAAGFVLGLVFALYMAVYVVNNFREHMSSQKMYLRLRNFLADQRANEMKELYKEDRYERFSYFGSPFYQPHPPSMGVYPYQGMIPRAHTRPPHQENHVSGGHVNPAHTDTESYEEGERERKYRQQNTFQRDLQRTLDQYRRNSDGSYNGHM